MLVLSRKTGQRIVVGDGLTITVLEVHKNRVRLGFEGPPDISIHREELARRIELAEHSGVRTYCG
jgi:carbon storage regulator